MDVTWWVTHGLDKLFPESERPGTPPLNIALKAARGETEDAQVALRIPRGPSVRQAVAAATDLRGPHGAALPASSVACHWVWYTYVLNNPPQNHDPATYLRKAPAFFPDAFCEEAAIRIRDEWTQPLWVSISVPRTATAGDYAGTLAITLTDDQEQVTTITVPIRLTVWNFALPAEPTLHQTEWMFPQVLSHYYRVEDWSEAHWEWIAKVAADMGQHRQDMILTPFSSLVQVTRNQRGTLRFDFRRLDRWVETFRRAGLTWIEGGHVAGRSGNWTSPFTWDRFPITGPGGQAVATARQALSDEAFEPWMEAFLKAIHAHLKERGWAERYVQHIADEPVPENQESWCRLAGKVRAWLPGVPTIDAVMSEGLTGFVDWRVPQIQHLSPTQRAAPGEQFWSYVCLAPQGPYPNRFLDYPSVRNRIIFWLSWSLGLKGFLHWGYNYWKTWTLVPVPVDVSPWLDATGASIYAADRQPLPAGDPFIVYPGRHRICSSIRWEVIRKGMEDFEYLYLLEQAVSAGRGDARWRRAASRLLTHVRQDLAPDPLNHTRDDHALLATREAAGELLSAVGGEGHG